MSGFGVLVDVASRSGGRCHGGSRTPTHEVGIAGQSWFLTCFLRLSQLAAARRCLSASLSCAGLAILSNNFAGSGAGRQALEMLIGSGKLDVCPGVGNDCNTNSSRKGCGVAVRGGVTCR